MQIRRAEKLLSQVARSCRHEPSVVFSYATAVRLRWSEGPGKAPGSDEPAREGSDRESCSKTRSSGRKRREKACENSPKPAGPISVALGAPPIIEHHMLSTCGGQNASSACSLRRFHGTSLKHSHLALQFLEDRPLQLPLQSSQSAAAPPCPCPGIRSIITSKGSPGSTRALGNRPK